MAAKKSFPLRLDPKLYEVLERWAADEFRSVNGHIEYLLREATARAGRLNAPRPRRPAQIRKIRIPAASPKFTAKKTALHRSEAESVEGLFIICMNTWIY
ncbi:hypothetical protein LJK87_27860 [Paenibacillus sp. P25]|nr:hypothetical protein LJK87_27860 [Paenibacillus sp. P25]